MKKEVNHHTNNGYPQTTAITPWPNGGPMPKNVWIGFKYIVRNIDNGAHVKSELYRDMSDGANGGTWTKMIEYTDTGGWGANSTPCAPGVDSSAILTQPNVSVYIRNDGIGEVDYKDFSVREVTGITINKKPILFNTRKIFSTAATSIRSCSSYINYGSSI